MINFLFHFLIKLENFLLIKRLAFPFCFVIEFRSFFHQLNIYGFLLSLVLGLGGFFPIKQNHNLKRLYACQSLCLRKMAIVISWSHMTSCMIDLTMLGQFYIITYPEIDLLFIIHHLTYLIKSIF